MPRRGNDLSHQGGLETRRRSAGDTAALLAQPHYSIRNQTRNLPTVTENAVRFQETLDRPLSNL